MAALESKSQPEESLISMSQKFAGVARKESAIGFLLVGLMSVLVSLPLANAAGGADPSRALPLTSEARQWSISLRWENDMFGFTDRYYTNGVSLSLAHSGPSWMDPLADLLPWGQGHRTVSYDIAQSIVTPADKQRSVPDPNDRPYAGILSLSFTLHLDRSNSYHGLKLVTGVVGPWSLAAETQREVHRHGTSPEPQGWDYQLENEPILNLAYEYRRKFRLAGRCKGWAIEAIPSAGGWLGNLLTQGQFGGFLRAGYNLPNDFGLTLIRGMGHLPPANGLKNFKANSNWGFSIYGVVLANLVLRDITLDGNTFTDSPRVDKNFFVPTAGFGMAIGNRHFQTSFTYLFWGKEFKGQQNGSKFGAITFSYLF
jgi:hypothetical protein